MARLICLYRGLWPNLERHQSACADISIVQSVLERRGSAARTLDKSSGTGLVSHGLWNSIFDCKGLFSSGGVYQFEELANISL